MKSCTTAAQLLSPTLAYDNSNNETKEMREKSTDERIWKKKKRMQNKEVPQA